MNARETQGPAVTSHGLTVQLIALSGVPLVKAGDDLAQLILAALAASQEKVRDGDILILAQKIVSKAQGRFVRLDSVTPSRQAEDLALAVNKDPRLVELILRESTEVVRYQRSVLVVAHRLGFVMANAGIDLSNVGEGSGDEVALLLPEDPDRTCAQLREIIRKLTGADIAVIINDSHGRAFRNGTVGVAIGASGLPALADLRGRPDLYRRRLQTTEVAIADEVAAAASLLMGQADEGRPIVLARDIPMCRREGAAAELARLKELDLFRTQASANTAARNFFPIAVRSADIHRDRSPTGCSNACSMPRSAHLRRITGSRGALSFSSTPARKSGWRTPWVIGYGPIEPQMAMHSMRLMPMLHAPSAASRARRLPS
jgi:coenzyme F420-0:L-glutamate ligase/coenzyme F420-1:gamma-L-glutamate ligase